MKFFFVFQVISDPIDKFGIIQSFNFNMIVVHSFPKIAMYIKHKSRWIIIFPPVKSNWNINETWAIYWLDMTVSRKIIYEMMHIRIHIFNIYTSFDFNIYRSFDMEMFARSFEFFFQDFCKCPYRLHKCFMHFFCWFFRIKSYFIFFFFCFHFLFFWLLFFCRIY